MIIIIKKDGQIVTDDGNPIEGKALEGAYMLLADAQDGDSIVYDGTNHMWKAGSGGGSFAPDITDPQDGDTLVYNATQQKWINGAGGSGGGGFLKATLDTSTGLLDKTWKEIYDAMANGCYCTVTNVNDNDTQMVNNEIFCECYYNEGSEKYIATTFIPTTGVAKDYESDTEDGYPAGGDSPLPP